MYDLPGRYNNLYKSRIHDTQSGILEAVPTKEAGPGEMLCNNVLTAQNFGATACFSQNYQRDELIPARRIQYDLLVEKALYPQIKKYEKPKISVPTPLLVTAVVLILIYFTKR